MSRGVYRLDTTHSCFIVEQECIYCLRVSFLTRRLHVKVAHGSRFGVACLMRSDGFAESGCGECRDGVRISQLGPCNLGERSRSLSTAPTYRWSCSGEWSGSFPAAPTYRWSRSSEWSRSFPTAPTYRWSCSGEWPRSFSTAPAYRWSHSGPRANQLASWLC